MLTQVAFTGIAVVALLVTGIGGAGALRIRGAAAFLAAGVVVASAAAVLSSLLLSAFDAWARLPMTACLVAGACGGWLAWWWSGRPGLPSMPLRSAWTTLAGPPRIAASLSVITLVVQAIVGALAAPSNWDSMTYHLSRAAYWLQEGSVGHFEGASLRQAASAPNAEILQGLTIMLTGSDRWVECVQWLSLGTLGLLIYSGARFLGFDMRASSWAAALFVMLPQPVMQSVSTQNDLLVAMFVAAAGFFGVRGLRDGRCGDVAVAAAAVGLAVGTKGTALVAGVALMVLALAAVAAYRPSPVFLTRSVVVVLVGLVSLGSANYVLNLQERGSLLGGLERVTLLHDDRVLNAGRVLHTFADAPGPLLQPVQRADWLPGLGVRRRLDTRVQEDLSAFGLVGFLVLPAALVVASLGRRSPRAHRVLAGAVLLYLLVFSLTVASNPWLGRLLIPLVALASPLLALTLRRPGVAVATLTLAVVSWAPSLLQNNQKPLLTERGGTFALAEERRTQMTVSRPALRDVLDELDAHVAPISPIAFVGSEDAWDYPFFGDSLQRRVTRLDPAARLSQRLLHELGVAGAVVADQPAPDVAGVVDLGHDHYWVPTVRLHRAG